MGIKDYLENRPVSAPLAGEDLYVSEQILQQYAESVEKLFREIADHFDQHEDAYY
jgi:hypothetical protein